MSGAKKFVDTLVANRKVVVFLKATCPYSAKARSAISSFALKKNAVEWIDLNGRSDAANIQDYLLKVTGARTVPRVFIGGKFFGGGDDTVSAKENGLLADTLRSVGAI
ncbi:unnamed protein product [Toxocara canis]|uniref:Glutaredoxin-1 n=1 Tax=Toxocara canis TaxID=6265 RepID=A0A183TYF0_TOXCA|nr:unnamed protein product [Toxocara canis]